MTPLNVEKITEQHDKFVCYPHNTALENNRHPKDPDIHRKADLQQVRELLFKIFYYSWKQHSRLRTILYMPIHLSQVWTGKVKFIWYVVMIVCSRMHFSWQKRDEDFELYRKPPLDFGSTPPITIHLAGEQRQKEIDEFTQKECEKWHSKVIAEQTGMTTHRLGTSTELSTKSCSVDKLKSLLKDEPQKLSLKLPGLRLVDSPALSTVQATDPKPNSNIPDDVGLGYNPGSMENRSLKLDKNVIPIADRSHDKFIKLKGQDFR